MNIFVDVGGNRRWSGFLSRWSLFARLVILPSSLLLIVAFLSASWTFRRRARYQKGVAFLRRKLLTGIHARVAPRF